MGFEWSSLGGFALAVGLAVLAEVALFIILRLSTQILRRRHPLLMDQYTRARRQLLVLSAVIFLLIAVATSWPHEGSKAVLQHILVIAIVAAAAGFLTSVVTGTVNNIRSHHPIEADDDQNSRRIQTQLSLIRGFVNAAIWLVALGFAFFTIPGAEAVGTSILASAGVASVIAGIAAQSLLGNVFAGLQLAFSGSVRVGDLIVATGQQGRVEEVTLTTVVVKTWDGRHLVLPSTYFTTTPFENWTHGSSEMMGVVQLDVDWRVSPASLRKRLEEVLAKAPLWDGKTSGLIVEDATGGMVRVRAVVSAADSSDLFDLRAQVREELVEWISSQATDALPVTRTLAEGAAPPPAQA
ncbi:mechanosensitive ion channel family protein [Schaalia sp. JY-X169]|jgi:small-conductance mechanosensitive channel|uniref:mechanosensitive ion channel family protein n=1 Tax=Schaalia sp. JY-X169 TaxID=2758572 RepID=UPI0015F39C80|nr:mechanosensitive ion channel family protein [Schaalia sp. JY-X169]